MKYFLLFAVFFFLSCKPSKKELSAQQIIDQSMIAYAVDKVNSSIISFDFRDKNYTATRNKGLFSLVRNFDSITDVLSNKGFQRFIHDKPVEISDSLATVYSNSVNSVHYFSVLPFGLNDKAVHKKQLPSVTIKGKEYYKIEITFSENGGGEDFEDVFIYWIDNESFLIDYMAYSYQTNGGGKRFRTKTNQQIVNGILFANYYNYKPKDINLKLVAIDKAFEENRLEKVSEIVLENISVKLLN